MRGPPLLDFAECDMDVEAQTITVKTVDGEFLFITGHTIAEELHMAADSRVAIEMTIVK